MLFNFQNFQIVLCFISPWAFSKISANTEEPTVRVSEKASEVEITKYRIQTLVVSRYATTTITCTIKNSAQKQKEALFSVMLPINAFISNLTIETGGVNYTSMVKEKQEARQNYEMAKAKSKNAAIIHQKERETNRFRIDVNVLPEDQVTFYLSYEELMQRSRGTYELRINVHPNYPVRNVFVDVTIHESRPLSQLSVVQVPGGEKFLAAVSEWREGNKTARIQFDPDVQMLHEGTSPLKGQIVIVYDVKRSLDAGDIQIENGFFVHFFAPVELQHTPKYITFLIDTSGSMSGTKLEQVKTALKRILLDLNKGDWFGIVLFNTNVERLVSARFSTHAVKRAHRLIDSLVADGGTDIDQGLKDALLYDAMEDTGVMSHIVVLLTDGQPTSGVIKHNEILKNARERNKFGASIYCLAFGDDADTDLLQKVSFQNGGSSTKIYEADDAALQLRKFYEHLATPLLIDVSFSYSKDSVLLDSLSNTDFDNYFEGSELVVTGQLASTNVKGVRANITGKGRNGGFTLGVNDWNTALPPNDKLLSKLRVENTPKNFIERLWVYVMIKELLKHEKGAIRQSIRSSARAKALQLALYYNFVTPLTSLVVIQADEKKCKDYDDDEYDYYDENGSSQGGIDSPTADPSDVDHFQGVDITKDQSGTGRRGKGRTRPGSPGNGRKTYISKGDIKLAPDDDDEVGKTKIEDFKIYMGFDGKEDYKHPDDKISNANKNKHSTSLVSAGSCCQFFYVNLIIFLLIIFHFSNTFMDRKSSRYS